MFQVFTCLTTQHDWHLVVLAGVVCLLSSACGISLFYRAKATYGRARLLWMGLDAAAAGCGNRSLLNAVLYEKPQLDRDEKPREQIG